MSHASATLAGPRRPHSGPAICGHCGHTNTGPHRFCGGCGAVLWESCPVCGATCTGGQAFCGECRADLAAHQRGLRAKHEATLEAARRLHREHDYDAALAKTTALTRLNDPRHADLAAQAAELRGRLAAEREARAADAQAARRQAQTLMERQDYEAALAALAAVPLAVRDDEFGALLHDVQAKRDEVRTLRAQAAAAIQSKDLAKLAIVADRLTTLRPADQDGRRLARQVRERLLRNADRRLAEQQYTEALRLLELVPAVERNAEHERLRQQAVERKWLVTDLKHAPVADRTLAAVAERLAGLCPDNPIVTKWRHRAARRVRETPRDPRHAAPPWTTPERSAFGFPVEWLGGFGRLGCPAALAERVREHPGRFYAACGLALHGLGRAAVEINLAPAKKARRFLGLPFGRKNAAAAEAWGLDVGVSALKVAKLVADQPEAAPRIEVLEALEYALPPGENAGAADHGTACRAALTAFVQKYAVGEAPVCIGLPGQLVLGRLLDLPPLDEKKLRDAVQYETQRQMPVPLDRLAWDYGVLRPPEKAGDGHGWRIAVQAVKQHHLTETTELLRELGLTVHAVQSDCLAVHNWARYELADTPFSAGERDAPAKASAIALLDVGARTTNLIVTAEDVLWFRNLAAGGESFTAALVREFKLTRGRAEDLKRHPEQAEALSRVYEAFEPTLAWLTDEVERSLEAYAKLRPETAIRQMYGLGGGFALHGLLRRLATGV